MNLGLQRRLIRGTDTGELLNDTLASLLVQTLGVALLSDFDRNINVDLNERQTRFLTGSRDLMQLARSVTVRSVRGDERSNSDSRAISEQLRDLSDTTDVLVAVLLAETQVLVQAESDIVAIQTVRANTTLQ